MTQAKKDHIREAMANRQRDGKTVGQIAAKFGISVGHCYAVVAAAKPAKPSTKPPRSAPTAPTTTSGSPFLLPLPGEKAGYIVKLGTPNGHQDRFFATLNDALEYMSEAHECEPTLYQVEVKSAVISTATKSTVKYVAEVSAVEREARAPEAC